MKVKKADNYSLSSKNYKNLDNYFKSNKFREIKVPKVINTAIELLGNNIPYKMRLFFAIQECSLLVSHMNNKIQLTKKTLVTTNMNNIMMSDSGTSKDKSTSLIRSCFKEEYNKIMDEMVVSSIESAKAKAVADGESEDDWKNYWKGKPKTLFPTVSSSAGMIDQMSQLQDTGLGAYFFQSSEFLSDLKSSPDIIDNIKNTSIGYDLGHIPSKIVKTAELQTDTIENLNINTLLFSSMHTLQSDKAVKTKFIDLFTIQLARRALFFMNTEEETIEEFDDLVSLVSDMSDADNKFEEMSELLTLQAGAILQRIERDSIITLDTTASKATTTEDFDVKDVFNAYMTYNKYRSNNIPKKYTMKAISTMHLQWKALKYAGLFSMLQGRMTLTKDDYFQAISIVELFNDDLENFQVEVSKEPYELFTEYVQRLAVDRKLSVSKHILLKEGFITGVASDLKLKELCEMCTLSDTNGVYIVKKGKIIYNKIKDVKEAPVEVAVEKSEESVTTTAQSDVQTTNVESKPTEPPVEDSPVNVSYKVYVKGGKVVTAKSFNSVKDFKAYRSKCGHYGFQAKTVPFKTYEQLVSKDVSYSPYHFGDGNNPDGVFLKGYRSMATTIDPSNTIVLDVDKASIPMEDMHELLSEHTHIIASTSDIENEYKYRIIFKLDRDIDLNASQWRKFYRSIAELLGIEVDPSINKASMFHGYDGAKVLTNYDGELLATKVHIINALKESDRKPVKVVKNAKQMDAQWDDRFDDFDYHYNVINNRIVTLYNAMRTACSKGWDKAYIVELIEEINDNFTKGAKDYRLVEKTVISQIDKFLNK
jgi:hypothetical protein